MRFAQSLVLLCAIGMAAAQARAENEFSVGVEGFRDTYKEPGVSVDTHTEYKSVTASDQYNFDNYFVGIQGRYSEGSADYKSVSGALDHIPELESDLRLLGGLNYVLWHGHLMPYTGVGWRYYFDQGKGLQTNTGALAYDRHISQVYIPIGATYKFNWGGFDFAPMAEFDALANGYVSTHLAPTGVDKNIVNIQTKGFGWRGEFMTGQQYKYFGWEVGPFVRYWNIQDSSCKVTRVTQPLDECRLEPANTRLQYGAAFRLNF